jgi:hypothetical protein
MGELAKNIIQRVKTARTAEDLEGWVWKASDLMAKSSMQEYHSGFAEIDAEVVSSDERDQLQSALLEALNRNSEPRFVSQIIDALGSAHDKSLRSLYVDYLVRYLRQLKDNNHIVYAALLALHNIGEPVYEKDSSGQSLIEIDKNIRQAHGYLSKQGITDSW